MSQKRHKEFKRERFSFVSCVPCSEAEKARVRTRVRSHAAQHRFKEDGRKIKTSRENKDDAIDTEIYGSYPTLSRQSASDTVSEPIFDWISNQNLISLYYSYYTSHRPTESHQDCSDPNDESNVINPQYPFSNSFVSGTLDPFMSYPSNSTSPDFFQECFSYSVLRAAPLP